MELAAVPSVAFDNAPDAVNRAMDAAHTAAGYQPVRTGTTSPSGEPVSSTAATGLTFHYTPLDSELATHHFSLSRARSEGSASTRDVQAAHEAGK